LRLEERVRRDLEELPEIRQELVDRIKKEIAEGTYMTPEKLYNAILELLKEVTGE